MKTNSLSPHLRRLFYAALLWFYLSPVTGRAASTTEPTASTGRAAATDVCLSSSECMAAVGRARDSSQMGQLATALAQYRRAYEQWPAPWLLFNIGRLLQKQERWEEARKAYETYLAEEDPLIADKKDKAEIYLQEVNKHILDSSRTTPASRVESATANTLLLSTGKVKKSPARHRWWVWTLAGGATAVVVLGAVLGSQPATIAAEVPRYQPFQ